MRNPVWATASEGTDGVPWPRGKRWPSGPIPRRTGKIRRNSLNALESSPHPSLISDPSATESSSRFLSFRDKTGRLSYASLAVNMDIYQRQVMRSPGCGLCPEQHRPFWPRSFLHTPLTPLLTGAQRSPTLLLHPLSVPSPFPPPRARPARGAAWG